MKKRITWVTQLKQSQIRSLKGELENLKSSTATQMELFKKDFEQMAEPMLNFARQL